MVDVSDEAVRNAIRDAFKVNYGVLHKDRDLEILQERISERTGERLSRQEVAELLDTHPHLTFNADGYAYIADDEYPLKRGHYDFMKKLFIENNGLLHRDVGINEFVNHYGYDKDEAVTALNEHLEGEGFGERGYAELQGQDHFDGNVGNLNRVPGEVTGKEWKGGLEILEDIDHPLVPDLDTYIEREVTGTGSKDVEILAQAMADPDFSPLLVGDAGTGKDTLVRYVCAQTNRPCIRVNFGKDVRYGDLVGTRLPAESEDGDGTKIVWEDGLLTRAVKYGYVFIADEINAAPPEATMPLHQVTEEGDDAELIIREESRIVTPHPQFRFVATMNPPRGGYGGVEPLNDAFKSRFYTIEVDYLEPAEEEELLRDQVRAEGLDVSDETIQELTELAANLREQYQRGDIMTPVTTRELLKICKMTEIMSARQAARMILTGHAKESDERLIEQRIQTEL